MLSAPLLKVFNFQWLDSENPRVGSKSYSVLTSLGNMHQRFISRLVLADHLDL